MSFVLFDKAKARKQIILLIVFIIVASVVVFLQVRNRKPAPPSSSTTSSVYDSTIRESRGTFLPLGTEFNQALFQDPLFAILKSFPPLVVDQSKLGVENPFSFE